MEISLGKISFGVAFVIALAALTVAALPVAAAESASDQIYVVDMQRVINESVIGKAARSNLESDAKKGQGKLEKLKQEVMGLRQSLEKQGSLLSSEAMQGKAESLGKKERELGRALQDQREELARKNNQEIKKVVDEIDKVVRELAKKKGYRFIIERDQQFVVYAEKDLDLTDEVISILDDKKVGL